MAPSRSKRENKDTQNGDTKITNLYKVRMSHRFVIMSLLACYLLAFAIGRTARMVFIVEPQKRLIEENQALNELIQNTPQLKLPNPIMKGGLEPPKTAYTSKNFDTARTATTISRFIVTDVGAESDEKAKECRVPEISNKGIAENEDQEVHEPKGQHLLVDIANVESAFLGSEERLSVAMLELVKRCGLTLLSYHCHGMIPTGVSCAGVLLESHVSFHTWPEEGVITLDLYTCGEGSLLPFVSIAKELFAIPSATADKVPELVWSHKFRGFTDDLESEIAVRTDFFRFPIGVMMDYKEEIYSGETEFQKVDIYDVLRPHFQSLDEYQKSLLGDGSYASQNPELFEPDRIVFLDGILQSRRSGDAAYHESLVHPGMFAHPNPKRVAIVGGGEGATLREVLKHSTVEELVMIEIDKKMVDISKQYLPFWSDCSQLIGSADYCFDDPRVDAYFEDAFKWFIDRFSSEPTIEAKKFDVIIIDALDPQVQVDIVDALYDGGPFLTSLPNSLRDDGILIAQVGEAARLESPGEEHSWHRNRVKFIKTLIDNGFESVRDYEESHAGFYYPWQFVVAFKSFESRKSWFHHEALTSVDIHERILPTKTGELSLRYFDGPTMMSYKFPSKASETVFCLRDSKSEMCSEGRNEDHHDWKSPVSALVMDENKITNKIFPSTIPDSNQLSSRERMISKYFTGKNAYNPLAERDPTLLPDTILKTKPMH